MRKKVTRKRISKAWMGLQTVAIMGPRRYEAKVRNAMDLLDQIRSEMRRKEIFAAGAKARKPDPRLDGEPLGSSESMQFFDGYRSTHPDFTNPYHRRVM